MNNVDPLDFRSLEALGLLGERKSSQETPVLQVNETVIPPISILDSIVTQIGKFPMMIETVEEVFGGIPSEIITPRGINFIMDEVSKNSLLHQELVHFLDLINIFEVFQYGARPSTLVEVFTQSVLRNRRHVSFESERPSRVSLTGNKAEIPSDLEGVFRKIPEIISLYLLAVICDIYSVNETDAV